MTLPDQPAFFDKDHNLWLQIDGDLINIPELVVIAPNLFMVEHNDPGRVFVNLTAYIRRMIE